MLKSKHVAKPNHLWVEETERQSSKLTKKKPKYQSIIRGLKAQIEELQREIEHHESEKDAEIRRLSQLVAEQNLRIRQLEVEHSRTTARLKNCSHKLGQLESHKVTFTIGSTDKKGNSSSARKREPSVRMTDRTPRKRKEQPRLNHPVFSKSTMDMALHASPARFYLSSHMDDIPLVNAFHTEEKPSTALSKGRKHPRSKIVCRSLRDEYKAHKCGSRCDFTGQCLR